MIDRLDEMDPRTFVVLELSSFQLEYMSKSPIIAAILNVTPNHLDRHGTFESYAAAKQNIIAFQGPDDHAVLNQDDEATIPLAGRTRAKVLLFSRRQKVSEGACLSGDKLVLRLNGRETAICSAREVRLLGMHNQENALAASAVASAAGADVSSIRKVLTTFSGVEHRLEPVREIAGVVFYNDSIATSPERALAGIMALERPILLIAGGKSKHLPLDRMVAAIVQKVRHIVLMGELGREIEEELRSTPGILPPITHCDTLAEAVKVSSRVARAGDAVLLSPGGTSFDLFRDFEDRGRQFKELVRSLPG